MLKSELKPGLKIVVNSHDRQRFYLGEVRQFLPGKSEWSPEGFVEVLVHYPEQSFLHVYGLPNERLMPLASS